jgi:aerobic carbon-monoxide dehydrogenase large subunit
MASIGTPAIGAPIRRREDYRFLTGQGTYTDDINRPGQLHAYILRSPHASARINRIDTGAAASAAGVAAVFTGADMAADGIGGLPCGWLINSKDGSPMKEPPHPVLAVERVRHVGDPVAVVLAESLAEARDAAEKIAVDYAVEPAVVDPAAALQPGAPQVWPAEAPGNVCYDWHLGDGAAVDAAFAKAAKIVKLDLVNNRLIPNAMEPRAAIGEFDPETGRYTLHAGAGGAVSPRRDLAMVLGVPPEEARVVMHDVGGNFGTRGGFNAEFAVVTWAARRVGRPVKWTCERSEYFASDHQARDLAVTAELALDADGRFLAMRGSNLVNQGAYALAFGSLNKGVEIMSSIYHVPAVYFRARAALTNTAPTRPYRSSGRPEVMFVMERLIDLAARQTGIDRIELRRRNLVPQSAMPYTNPFGMIYDSGDYIGAMEHVLRLADWDGLPARRAEASARGKCRGIGIANYVDTATGAPREKAEVTVMPEGAVEVVVGTVSQGQGHETTFAQLVTEWLGVPLDSVRLVTGDTDRVSVGGGAHSGRALRLASIVMLNASNEIIEKGLRIASHMLEAAPADLEFVEGEFRVKGTDRALGIFAVARAALERGDLPEELKGPLRAESDETNNLAAFPYGCHVCEVEVDPETGKVGIVRYSAVDDVGRAVNPMIVHGQIHGGIVQGVGQAMGEQIVYDRDSGQLLSGSFMDYTMPRADTVPFFATELSEIPTPNHPLGIRPAGEGGTTPALGVVINAIVDALAEFGVSQIEMPATSERVWRAIHCNRALTGANSGER